MFRLVKGISFRFLFPDDIKCANYKRNNQKINGLSSDFEGFIYLAGFASFPAAAAFSEAAGFAGISSFLLSFFCRFFLVLS